MCSCQGRLRPARIGKHMFAECPPSLQVFLAMPALWHTIEAVLMGLVVSGLNGIDGDKLFVLSARCCRNVFVEGK